MNRDTDCAPKVQQGPPPSAAPGPSRPQAPLPKPGTAPPKSQDSNGGPDRRRTTDQGSRGRA
ncbi:hypothetical protein TWF569_000828 [Orbilia oligospora]|uniref:Uncharacterized protein n=1 Tax=Orbilia oligospora TaxID=2813651 RepID=A0A7C8N3T6_ORBOL|nr:hypothetical protein TWF102_001959 [Orbilia oligospora]KAF3089889.1 hypothetical protein TWF706_010272 [Orbilia oligospora]KAF3094751.1 hypothetical protein TWF103_010461 [Orbilia oligospora]KAF3125386.1 hypothetical protein TWF569_000828 [Orbilia oligospora]KAF3164139.1 hypothetical protein TWF225_001734 [Orbilia oligospora]